MRWKKLGLVFKPEGNFNWMLTHAANPVALHLKNNLFRVFFSSRDKDNRAHIGFVEIDITNPSKILRLSENPVITPGPLGTFDDSGVSMGCITEYDGKHYLYYLGWNLGVTVPWRNSIGLAISEDGSETFKKIHQAPVMDRSATDPYSISYPWVLKENGKWHMWYGSNLSWGKEQKDMAHVIKYASSTDGVNWKRTGEVALRFKDKSEYAMSKPSVLKENVIYKMWYSYRGDAYRIGYAESEDGIHFQRKDELAGISPTPAGWDGESVEYPNVIDHKGEKYMFYNGNQYGFTGFGLAVLE